MKLSVILLLLVIGMGYPVFKPQFTGPKQYNQALEDLMELQKLDSKTNELIMRSRLGIDRNYDNLSALPAKIDSIQTKISTQDWYTNSEDNRLLASSYKSYLNAEQNKDSIIDNFKAHNSVLRNSVRYAPIAADRLIQATIANQLIDEAEILKKLKADILQYSLTGRNSIRRNISGQLENIKDLGEKLPEDNSVLAANFNKHVDVIIREQYTTDRYLKKAINSKASASLSNLIDIVKTRADKATKKAGFHKKVLSIYLGVLGLLMLYIAIRMWGHRPAQL